MENVVLGLVVLGVVLVGAIVYYNRKSDSLDIDGDGDIDKNDAKAALKNAEAGLKEDAVKAVNEAKEVAEDVVEEVVEEVKAKLPTKAKLTAMTKAKLEELGREFGVELDKRKKKEAMVADLQAGVKQNNAKTQLK